MIIQRLFSLRNNAPDIIELDNEITLEKSGFGVIARVLRNFKSIRRRQDKQLNYDIRLGNKKIGYLQIYETIPNSEINIMWFGISKGYEENHYATKAMKSILEWAKKNGFKKVTLEVPGSSPNARHIYDKLGFKVVKEEESEFWDGLTYMEKIFSEEKKSNKTRNSLIAGAGFIGTDAALTHLNRKSVDKLEKKWKEEAKKDKESKKIYGKLKKNFKKSGDTILEEGKDIGGNIIRENQSGIIEEGSKKGNKIIQISGKAKGNASVLGHELGHIHYLSDPKADRIGKYAHKLAYPISGNSTLIGLGAGIASGVRSAKKEEKGEKEGALGRSSGILAATSSNIPRLVAEGKASQRGYKLMKNAGASDRLLKSAKGNYKKMLLSYGSGIATDIGVSELGRAAGRAYYNNIAKENKDDNSKK